MGDWKSMIPVLKSVCGMVLPQAETTIQLIKEQLQAFKSAQKKGEVPDDGYDRQAEDDCMEEFKYAFFLELRTLIRDANHPKAYEDVMKGGNDHLTLAEIKLFEHRHAATDKLGRNARESVAG